MLRPPCSFVRRGLRLVMLVSPTTSQARRERIATLSSGFVYYLSVAGITFDAGATGSGVHYLDVTVPVGPGSPWVAAIAPGPRA